jgi:hypothetical protein
MRYPFWKKNFLENTIPKISFFSRVVSAGTAR